MPKVFISYAHQDTSVASLLRSSLVSSDYQVWMDSAVINVGERWEDIIRKAIAEADIFVAVVSPSSLQSAWFNLELGMALGGQRSPERRVILVTTHGLNARDLPHYLGDLKTVELSSGGVTDAVQRILEADDQKEPHNPTDRADG